MAKKSNAAKIREYMARNPDVKPAAVAEKFGINVQYVYVLRSLMKKQTKLNPTMHTHFETPVITMPEFQALTAPTPEGVNIDLVHAGEQKKPDMVNHPPHYKAGGVETINFIEAKGLDYHLGNVVKYITRAGKKDDEIQDLKKARWYLERAIAVREGSVTVSISL